MRWIASSSHKFPSHHTLTEIPRIMIASNNKSSCKASIEDIEDELNPTRASLSSCIHPLPSWSSSSSSLSYSSWGEDDPQKQMDNLSINRRLRRIKRRLLLEHTSKVTSLSSILMESGKLNKYMYMYQEAADDSKPLWTNFLYYESWFLYFQQFIYQFCICLLHKKTHVT